MPTNGRAKGARGELEFVAWLKQEFGYDGRRSQQYCGTAGDADVVTELDPVLFVDVKRVELLRMYEALEQVQFDARDTDRIPVVMHKKNRGDWIAILDAATFIELLRHHPGCPSPGAQELPPLELPHPPEGAHGTRIRFPYRRAARRPPGS